MKNIFKTKKQKFQVVITILSVLSLIPFGILLYHLYQLQEISTTEMNNEDLINIVLSRTISSPMILLGFVIGVVIWVSNSVVSSIAIHKKMVTPLFGYATLILGGLGVHIFIIIFYYVKKRMGNKQERTARKSGTVAAVSVVTAFIGAIAAFFGMGLSINNYDAPYLGQPVQLSTENTSPNVIEIFTDGFDQWNKDQYEDDIDFKDFNWFSKYQTVGTATHRSVPSIWGDFTKMNPFEIRRENNIDDPAKLGTTVYGKSFLESAISHMNQYKNYFSQRSVVNTICMSDNPGYGASTSGTPKALAKLDDTLNITNWSGAREYNAGKFGVSNLSPDGNSYKYFADSATPVNKITKEIKGKVVHESNKGAYVLINDLITHKPYMSSASGDFTIFNTNAEDQKTVLRNNLKNIFAKLKNDVLDGRSAYDNSMIIIYGDHSNHYRNLKDEAGTTTKYRHAESALMIKYPNYTSSPSVQTKMNIIDDRVVYGASINSVINHFVNNKQMSSKEQIDWIKTDPLFESNISRPTFYDDDHFMMTKWKTGADNISRLVPDKESGNKYEYTYKEWESLAKADDPLESVVF